MSALQYIPKGISLFFLGIGCAIMSIALLVDGAPFVLSVAVGILSWIFTIVLFTVVAFITALKNSKNRKGP